MHFRWGNNAGLTNCRASHRKVNPCRCQQFACFWLCGRLPGWPRLQRLSRPRAPFASAGPAGRPLRRFHQGRQRELGREKGRDGAGPGGMLGDVAREEQRRQLRIVARAAVMDRRRCLRSLSYRSGVSAFMHDPAYYREQADRARRLAAATTDRAARESLEQLACDYTEIADELEQNSDLPAPELPETARY